MIRVPAFVGRVAELAALEEALAAAILGRGGAVMLEGEPGIGKTRLASELAARAERRGARVLWARCAGDAEAPAFWPFAQLLRPLYADHREDDLAGRFGPGARDAFATMRGATPAAASSATLAAGGDPTRFRFFDAVAAMLVAAASDRPLVIVFDDAHAADPGCLQLLLFVVRALHGARVLVVVTLRSAEARRADVAPVLLGGLAREALALSLDGWSREEVGAFFAQARDAGADAAAVASLVESVHRASAGNPFFVGEIARLLRPGRDGTTALPVPAHVRQAVEARHAALSAHTAAVLDAAAIVGLAFDEEVIAAVTGIDPVDVARALAEAAEAGFVEAAGDSAWSFRHEIARDVLLEKADAAARRHGHLAAARCLDRGARGVEAVAHHLLAALPDSDLTAAVERALAVAAGAAAASAYERAASWLRRALDALARHGVAETDRSHGDAGPALRDLRGRALLALGDAAWAGGDFAASRAAYEQAAELARADGDGGLLARAALGIGGRQQRAHVQHDPSVVALLREALSTMGDGQQALRARLEARLAYALYAAPGSRAERQQLADSAVATARRAGDEETLRWALGDRRWALWGPADLDARRALGEELLDAARKAGDREAVLVEQGWRVADALEAGDRAALDEAFASYRAGAAQLRLPWYEWYATRMACLVAQVEGRLDDAERLAAEALAAGQRAGHPDASLTFGTQLLGIRLAQERSAEIASAVETSLAQYPDVTLWRRLLARVRIAQGRDQEAAGEVERARRGALVEAPGDFLHLPSLAILAEVVGAAGDDHVRRRVRDALEPWHGRQVVLGFGLSYLGPVDLYAGELAAACGDHDDARAALERASIQAGRLGAARWAARARATLRVLGSAAPRRAPAAGDASTRTKAVLRADGSGWHGEFGGKAFRLGSLRGVVYLKALIDAAGRDLHVLELAAIGETGPATRPGKGIGSPISDRADSGDAGPLLDDRAKRAYRSRLSELAAELDEATDFADAGRMALLRAEIESIEEELARAVGLGGRDRPGGTAAERARVAVAKRIRGALERIGEQNPGMQRYLEATVRTGTFCVYRPDPGRPVDWET